MRETVVLVIVLATSSLTWGESKPCPCSPRTEPGSYSQRIQKTTEGADLEWFSDADKYASEPGVRYCYERTVTNHHPTAPLRFDWPVGRLNAESLAPGGELTRTCTYYGETTTRDGPLHYGRGNSNTPTKVWEGQNEPAPTTLTTIVEVVALVSGEKWPGKLSLVSTAKETGIGGFEYRYELSLRPGSKELAVNWLSADSRNFRAELERTKQRSPLALVPDKTLEVTFKSSGPPTVRGGNVLLYGGRDNTLLLTAGAAAYVPRQR